LLEFLQEFCQSSRRQAKAGDQVEDLAMDLAQDLVGALDQNCLKDSPILHFQFCHRHIFCSRHELR